jgi:hypothetical protein
VTRYPFSASFRLLIGALALTVCTAATVHAQTTDDDDAKLRPAEPDFFVINLPTTLPLPVHKGSFHLTHRFGENLRADSFKTQLSNLFGMDQGATIQFEYRFGVMKHVEAVVARTNFNKTFQFSGKYDAIHQSDTRMFGLSALVSVEGGDNFQESYKPALGVTVSHAFGDRAAGYVVPVWVHNSAAGTGITRDTGMIGFGGRVRFADTNYVFGEVTPRIGGYAPGDPEVAFGYEKRVGGHVFSLVLANTPGTTFGHLAAGGFPHNLQLGFNLARKFF